MKNVVIAKYLTHDLILGTDWMEAAGVGTFPENEVMKLFWTDSCIPPLSAQVKSKSSTNYSVEVADEPIIHEAALREDMPAMGPFFDIVPLDYFNNLDEVFEEDKNEVGTLDQQTNQKKNT